MRRARLFFFWPVLLAACQPTKLEFSLTDATQQGANTMSCLVDEQVFRPYGRKCVFGGVCEEALSVHYNPQRGRLTIEAILVTTERDERVSIACDSVFRAGPVGTQRPFSYTLPGVSYSTSGLNFSTATPPQTSLFITRLDTTAHIIAGTFAGHLQGLLVNPTGEKTAVSITEGRFDVTYTK